MKLQTWRWAFGLVVVVGWVQSAAAQTGTVRVATGLDRPVFATAPAGDTGRLFIAEQHTGRIEILDLSSGNVLATPFLDLSGLSTGNEQGLLGLAFDPDYATNGYFYVNLNTSADGGDTHIRRYQVQGNPITSNVANAASQFEILSFNQPQSNHNGGWIDFSPNDGYLYIATGDGGGSDDNDSGHTAGTGNAQDIDNNLLGKMLRIDVAGDEFPADANRNYAIPADNPFVGVTGDDEIWAFGLRNPYRASFDRATGDLWIGDVGQDNREEIDFQPANSTGGENYGWRLREGTIATPTGGVGGNPPAGNVEPIYDYRHDGPNDFRGNVVNGGYVYRGPVAQFQGHYFFADTGSGNIWKLDPEAVDPRASVARVNDLLTPNVSNGGITGIGSFGEDAAGNLYMMEVFGGELFRITTASQDIVWNGEDPSAGAPGDGTTWGDANNWTRGGVADTAFVAEDHVFFAPRTSPATIALGGDRTVSAATFQSDYTLTGDTLRVLSGNVTVEAGAIATIESTLAAETTNHSLRKLGPGTLLVEGAAGQTVVKAGALGGNGTLDYLTVNDGGTVAPGASIGTLSVDGGYVMEPGSTLSIELGGTEVGTFDQLHVAGAATLDGTLHVSLVDDFTPQAGDSIPFLVAELGAGGVFDELELPDLPADLRWFLNPGDVSVFLEVRTTFTADFDKDGDVDSADLAEYESRFGVDLGGRDALNWLRQFGSDSSTLAVSQQAPEPSCILLLTCAALSFACARRTKPQ